MGTDALLSLRNDLTVKSQICVAVYQLSNQISRFYNKAFADFDLTFTQYQILLVLIEQNVCNVGKICTVLCLETSTITPALKRLEALGYVVRQRDQADERRVHVSLTNKGKHFEKEARALRCRLIDSLGPGIAEIADLLPMLQKLSVLLDRADAILRIS